MLVYGMLYKKGQKRKNWNMRLYVRFQDSLPHNLLQHRWLHLSWYLNRLFEYFHRHVVLYNMYIIIVLNIVVKNNVV